MPARLPRVVLVGLIILGLLMPRVSAVVASVAPGVQTIVICTGAGLQTIQIGEDGKPVAVSHQVDHCVLTHAADTAGRVEPAPVLAPLAWAIDRPGDQVRASGYQAARPPPRAPPLEA
jgi:glyoxylase-like metal-dependent hydrolase (beta-lactamase superfamily II)